jgi:hypothetical protein
MPDQPLRWIAKAATVGLAISLCAACGPMASNPPEEHMPAPASIWLTSVPQSPDRDVDVALVIEGEINRSHTFPAGAPLRGSFAVSDRTPYRLTALDEACSIDFDIPAEQEADVVLTLSPDETCSLAVAGFHPFERSHGGPSVLIEP